MEMENSNLLVMIRLQQNDDITLPLGYRSKFGLQSLNTIIGDTTFYYRYHDVCSSL